MITINNYSEKEKSINWSDMPQAVAKNRNDVVGMFDLYGEDPDIDKTIDTWLSLLNQNADTTMKKVSKKKSVKKAASKLKVSKKATTVAKKETIEDVLLQSGKFRTFVPRFQQMTVANSDEFIDDVKRINKELEAIPNKEQGGKIGDQKVYARYFSLKGDTHYFVLDYANKEPYGYAVLNGDLQMAEPGYLPWQEIKGSRYMELDFHFEPGRTLNEVLHSIYPNEVPKPGKKKPAKAKKKINKKVDVTFVDAYSEEFKLLRRFRNVIKKEKLTFKQLRLLYMAFNKAVVSRKVRKQAENADEFTKANAGITKLFSQVKDENLDDEKLLQIDIENESLVNEINKFVDGTKVNYAVTLLRSFISLQGTKPATEKVERLLKRFENGVKKNRVTKDNRLFDQVKDAIKEMKEYLDNPEEKIDVEMYGLSAPRNLCQNRIKCEGLKPSGQLKPGYKFIEGGAVVKAKKKSKDQGLNYPMAIEDEADEELAVLDDFEPEVVELQETIEQPGHDDNAVATVHEAKVIEHQEPTPELPKLPSRKNSKIRNMADKSERTFEFYNVPGETGKFLQRVERKPKGSVAITLSAPKGAGKTTLMYQMMNDFAAGKNPSLFVSLEEDPESVLAEDKRVKYIDDANKPYIDEVGEIKNKQELYDLIEQYDIIFIDSWQKLLRLFKITFDEGLRKRFDGKVFVVIFQETVDGRVKGGADIEFDGDIITKVHKGETFAENYAWFDKNRYTTVPIHTLKYMIADQKFIGEEEETLEKQIPEKIPERSNSSSLSESGIVATAF